MPRVNFCTVDAIAGSWDKFSFRCYRMCYSRQWERHFVHKEDPRCFLKDLRCIKQAQKQHKDSTLNDTSKKNLEVSVTTT
jgi:hypothetical protein